MLFYISCGRGPIRVIFFYNYMGTLYSWLAFIFARGIHFQIQHSALIKQASTTDLRLRLRRLRFIWVQAEIINFFFTIIVVITRGVGVFEFKVIFFKLTLLWKLWLSGTWEGLPILHKEFLLTFVSSFGFPVFSLLFPHELILCEGLICRN